MGGGDDGDGYRHNRHTDITSGWVHHNKLDKMAISKNYKFCSCLLAQEFSSGKSRSLFESSGDFLRWSERLPPAPRPRCAVRPSIGRTGTAPNPRRANIRVGKQTRAELLFLLYSSGIWSDVGADVGSRAVGHVDQWEVVLAAPYREALCN